MAISTGTPCPVYPDDGRMEPPALVQAAADFLMAIQTLKGRRYFGKIVALGAVRRAAQKAMRR